MEDLIFLVQKNGKINGNMKSGMNGLGFPIIRQN